MAQTVPHDYGAVTPYIVVNGAAKLIDFLKAAFGAEERMRFEMPDGTLSHAVVKIGDSIVQMFDARPGWPDTPAFIQLYVPDADATLARALKAGATEVTPMGDGAWGDRIARVRDPFGNIWWIQTHTEDVDDAEMRRRLIEEPAFQANMKQAAETFDREMRSRAH